MTLPDGSPLPANLIEKRLQTKPEQAHAYGKLTSDLNPIHLDADFAAATPFGKPIIHGTMGLGLLLTALEETFGGEAPAGDLNVRFAKPVHVGATIRAGGHLTDSGSGTYAVFVETGDGTRAVEGTFTLSGE